VLARASGNLLCHPSRRGGAAPLRGAGGPVVEASQTGVQWEERLKLVRP